MSLSERLIDTWRLVSFEYARTGGDVSRADRDNPDGLLVFDDTGH